MKKIFATEAEADYWAKTGRFVSGRNDPRDLDGVKDFSAEGGRREDRVTVHDMFTDGDATEKDGDVGYLSGNTGVVNDLGHILIDGKPR
ncbi:hypothetical protein [Mycetocola tolaasinivorans]|uniref:hypothetical protein n=1 Tax=Mycetocola tolaasinivorans TaxID=76635 RepID=UPI001FE6E9F7|nr:hypothetical protein [Mycetocola tolaasinivorans]